MWSNIITYPHPRPSNQELHQSHKSQSTQSIDSNYLIYQLNKEASALKSTHAGWKASFCWHSMVWLSMLLQWCNAAPEGVVSTLWHHCWVWSGVRGSQTPSFHLPLSLSPKLVGGPKGNLLILIGHVHIWPQKDDVTVHVMGSLTCSQSLMSIMRLLMLRYITAKLWLSQ